MLNTPVLVRSTKLSSIEPRQYLDGRPPGNTGCCWHLFVKLYVSFQVLFRMNFLTVMLCITMNRPYQFYQFVPLATFAFVMQYAVMICPPHVTASDVDINLWKYAYMLIKFIVFGFISTMLYMSQVIYKYSTRD